MVRKVNFVRFILLFLAAVYTLFVHNDLSFGTLQFGRVKYQEEIYLGLGAVMVVLSVLSMQNRWMGVSIFGRKKSKYNFIYDEPIGNSGFKWQLVFSMLELLFLGLFGYYFIVTHRYADLLGIVLILWGVEQLLFLLINRNKLRVAVSENMVVFSGRQINIYPIKGLNEIERSFDKLMYRYKSGAVKPFPYYVISSNCSWISRLDY